MDYFIPKLIKGTTPGGKPFTFFRGIHNVPDDLANHGDANKLGIIPVEEMTDDQWRMLALDKAKWMAANRPAPVSLVTDDAADSSGDDKAAIPAAQKAVDADPSAKAATAPANAQKTVQAASAPITSPATTGQ